ncbi:serine hydrolase [Burkholderia sp. WAC0059]|nr:serine hydrolase [Burkholderia sp. WAC0059]
MDSALAGRRLVGAVVLVARDGEPVYRRAAGFADREAGTPMREDAIFRLASLTKPIVSTAALRLVERRVLRLDAPVTQWLPAFRPRLADGSEPVITIRHLLTHTAGLTYGFLEPETSAWHAHGVSDGLDDADVDLDENLRRLATAPLSYAPGSAWRYSLAIDVLGAVVAAAGGRPLPQMIDELIAEPLGMTDTGFVVPAGQSARLAAPYGDAVPEPTRMPAHAELAHPSSGGILSFAPGRALNPSAWPSGGAGMVGTASDFLRLLECLRKGGDGLLETQTVAQMTTDQVGVQPETIGPGWGFGYGASVLVDPAAAATPQSPGTFAWGGAYGHSWFVDPRQALSVVALTNTAFEGMSGRFTLDVRDAAYRS